MYDKSLIYPVAKCAHPDCKAPYGGMVEKQQVTPGRRKGDRFGFPGQFLCMACDGRLRRQARQAHIHVPILPSYYCHDERDLTEIERLANMRAERLVMLRAWRAEFQKSRFVKTHGYNTYFTHKREAAALVRQYDRAWRDLRSLRQLRRSA